MQGIHCEQSDDWIVEESQQTNQDEHDAEHENWVFYEHVLLYRLLMRKPTFASP